MDEKLSGYINSQAQKPPAISEAAIVRELAWRERRKTLVMLSLAALLWTTLLYGYAFVLGRENQAAGIALLCAISVGYIGAGCFAGIILKFRKAGL